VNLEKAHQEESVAMAAFQRLSMDMVRSQCTSLFQHAKLE